MELIDPHLSGDLPGRLFHIAGQHDRLPDARFFQFPHGFRRVILELVGNHDMARVLPVDRRMYDRACTVALRCVQAQIPHQLPVARGHHMAVHHRADSSAGNLFHIADPVHPQFFSISPLQAQTDRMGGMPFRVGRVLQQLPVFQRAVMDSRHLKIAFCDRAGLIKDNSFDRREGLHKVGPLDQDALAAGAAQASEKAERDADHNGAGTADDQEGKRPVDPCPPLRRRSHERPDHRRQDRQGQRAVADSRRIDFGEFGNELFGPGFSGAGVLDQIQDFGSCRFIKFTGRLHMEKTGCIDEAGQDLIPGTHFPWQALSCQGSRIHGGTAFRNDTVNGHLFTGPDHNDTADLNFIRIHFPDLAVLFQIGVIRPDIHQLADTPAAAADGPALEKLSDLVEPHDRHALRILTENHGADGGHGHQEVLIKDLPVHNAFPCLAQDIISYRQIRNQIEQKAQDRISVQGKESQDDHADAGGQDPDQQIFLFLIHGKSPLFRSVFPVSVNTAGMPARAKARDNSSSLGILSAGCCLYTF